MRPDLVSWRPNGAPSAASMGGGLDRVQWSSHLTIAGAALALGLLIGFYWVVSSLVQHAENGREPARLAIDRQVVCGAFANASSRELCASTVAAQAPVNAVLRASYVQSSLNGPKRHMTASRY